MEISIYKSYKNNNYIIILTGGYKMLNKSLKVVLVGSLVLPIGLGLGQISNKADASENWVNKDLKAPAVTKSNLKMLEQGSYKYNGLYLGVSKKDVVSKIGVGRYAGGTHDSNIKDDGVKGTFYYSMYGKGNKLALHFYDRDSKKNYNYTKLTQMDFRITNEKGYSKKNIEKYLGKADEYYGNMKKTNYISRTYGHLDVAYMKDAKTKEWKAIGLTYHSPRNDMGVFEYNKYTPTYE